MKVKIQKTNAMRFLDQKKKSYEILTYEYDEDHLGAEHVCKSVHKSPEEVYKTLLFEGNQSGILVGFVAGNQEIDEKKLAQLSGNKKITLVSLKDVEKVSGYIRGGVSPIGLKKSYPIYGDRALSSLDKVCFSAGKRGLQIYMKVSDLLEVLDIKLGEIS